MAFFHGLIKTHHMTSRRKIVALTHAASKHNCAVLIRTGGVPGIMFVKGRNGDEVQQWMKTVRNLRYKDFRAIGKVEQVESGDEERRGDVRATEGGRGSWKWKWGSVREVGSVKEFAAELEEEEGGEVVEWWRRKMGFLGE